MPLPSNNKQTKIPTVSLLPKTPTSLVTPRIFNPNIQIFLPFSLHIENVVHVSVHTKQYSQSEGDID